MTKLRRDGQELIRDSLAAVREALSRSHLYKAWELLQERDADGNPKGALPYTDQALAEFAAAHEFDPDDIGIVHHLAIAHHARAWDWELSGNPNAASEWERALDYWRAIAASSAFWASLKDKFLACDPDGNAAWLDEVRQNLLENLLDIHVDFVRYYCEGALPEHAIQHVEIVRRTRLPPAIKRRLIGKVFDAMTSAVPEAKATRAYTSALTSLERFLALFPDYLPALRMYAEICNEYLAAMSYGNWDDIVRLGAQVEPYMRRLAAHPELGSNPLAQTALEELAGEFALRGSNQGDHYYAAGRSQLITQVERDAACNAYEFSIGWGRLGYPNSPGGSQVRMICAACLNDHASLLYQDVVAVGEANTDPRTKLHTVERLLRLAVADLEEGLICIPGDTALASNLQALSESLADIESKRKRFDIFNDMGDQP
jgi:hypothetical protein